MAKDAKKQNRHKNCNVIFIPRNFGNILVKSVSVCLERFQRYSVCKKVQHLAVTYKLLVLLLVCLCLAVGSSINGDGSL